jgi:membrane protease YdiL (CAAX protease family)
MAGTGFVQQAVGLEGIRSLQPTLKGYRIQVLLGLSMTGTFLEEILYRGYLIERVTMLTRRRWFAALISWAAFTLVHLRWVGIGPLLDVAVTSAAFVVLYLRERSTWPCVVLHGINSTVAYILGPLLLP